MKLAIALASALLALTLATPAHVYAEENVTLEVGPADLCATVPLCTYSYTVNKEQGITPKLTVTNQGFSPITVIGANLPDSMAILESIPCDIMPTMHQDFALTENPSGQPIQKQAVKQQVIFIISKIVGG